MSDLTDGELRRVLAMLAEGDREMGDGAAVEELLGRGYVIRGTAGFAPNIDTVEVVNLTEKGAAWLEAGG